MTTGPTTAAAVPTTTEAEATQRRTVPVLLLIQVVGSVAVACGIATAGLLVAVVVGTPAAAGFAQAASILGSALLAVPAARIAARSGRRPSLAATYLVAALGGLLVVAGAAYWWPLMALGMLLFGGGTAANMQLRFAGTDLAPPHKRGRTLSLVLFAVTAGGVVGPNLAGPTAGIARAVGLPDEAGPVMLAVPLLVLAALVCVALLRPDPLVVARRLGRGETGTPVAPVAPTRVRDGLRRAWAEPDGRLGLLAVVSTHATMVAVMVMTPVHIHGDMQDGGMGGSLEVVGVVISVHIAGMYAFSPVVGWLTDRIGARAMVRVAAVVQVAACVVAATAGGDHVRLGLGLFLLGVGWSCALVPGSVLVTGSVGPDERPVVQGATDLTMGLGGAVAAVGSGPLVALAGFPTLGWVAAALAVPAALLSLARAGDRSSPPRA